MVVKKRVRAEASRSPMGGVDEFLRKLEHPLKPALEAVRRIILAADAGIREGIKWNSPSFHYKEYFATAGLSPKNFVLVVFHRGAKVKDNAGEMRIDDPAGLLEWHAKDRCSARFRDLEDVDSKESALRDIVRRWIRQM
ncbi:MAG: DUF1801 domain-containing protein [Planctomycetota bacterium]